jgi:hypothetical protein
LPLLPESSEEEDVEGGDNWIYGGTSDSDMGGGKTFLPQANMMLNSFQIYKQKVYFYVKMYGGSFNFVR